MSRKPRPLRSVWRDLVSESGLDPEARPVALALALYLDGQGVCWPSRPRLAGDVGRAVRTIDRALARLEAAGLLNVERSGGGRPENTNTYVALCPPTASERLRAEWERGVTHDPPGASPVTERGVTRDQKGRHPRRPKSNEAIRSGAPTAAAPLSGSAASAHAGEKFAPEDMCWGCGKLATLVGPDFQRCADCRAALDVVLAEDAAVKGRAT